MTLVVSCLGDGHLYANECLLKGRARGPWGVYLQTLKYGADGGAGTKPRRRENASRIRVPTCRGCLVSPADAAHLRPDLETDATAARGRCGNTGSGGTAPFSPECKHNGAPVAGQLSSYCIQGSPVALPLNK